jgi:hypothetical protein
LQTESKQPKQPYFISLKDKEPFAFAGLWEQWDSPEGQNIQSYSIITTDPNELMAPIHNRMPVILGTQDYSTWLDPEELPKNLKGLLRPFDGQHQRQQSPESGRALPCTFGYCLISNDPARFWPYLSFFWRKALAFLTSSIELKTVIASIFSIGNQYAISG